MHAIVGDVLPDIVGEDGSGGQVQLHSLLKPGRYALVWWHPRALAPGLCRTCSGNAVSDPIKTLVSIYEAGCDVIGLTYEERAKIEHYQSSIGLEYPTLTVKPSIAALHGVAKDENEPWPNIPRRIAFLVDEHGQIINRYEVHEPVAFLHQVEGDVRNGPPLSKWEPPKRGWLRRLIG